MEIEDNSDVPNAVEQNYIILENLFINGDDIQKLSIIQTLPQLAQIDAISTHSRILPKIIQDLPHSSSEFQVTASRIFKVLIQGNIPVNLIGSITQGIESRDANVSNSWCETLLDVIPYLPDDCINTVVLPMATLKAQHNQHPVSKMLSCRILANICCHPKLKIVDIKKDILPTVLSLCQDVSPDVRATMGGYLPDVAQGLGANLIKPNLLPTLVELASDKNCLVRGTTIPSVSAMLQYLDPETKKQTMVPLIKQLCEHAIKKEDTTAAILANDFGVLLQRIEKNITLADAQYFLKCFKTISQRGKSTNYNDVYSVDNTKEVMCRDRVAFNLPTITEFTLKIAPDELTVVYSIFRELAADSCYIVRRTIASTLAEMSRILGEQNKLMRNDVVRIFRDDAEEVLLLLVPNIADTLLKLCEFGTLSNTISSQATMDIGRALFKCQMEIAKGYNWRLMVSFLKQLEYLPLCMPCDFIHNHFTPVILERAVSGRARPIRMQSIRTVLVFLRYYTKDNQQKWLRDSLVKQIGLSTNAYTRVMYPIVCDAALDIFSEKYFKEHFLQTLLKFPFDKIPTVRYSFVQISTKLRQLATLNTDQRTKEMINDAIQKMEQSEKCKDVLDALKKRKKDTLPKKNDERLLEEDKRVKEELTGIRRNQPQMQQKTPSTVPNVPITQKISTATNQPGPQTALNRNTLPPQHDMKFLEQHFYIDAGVTLPTTSTYEKNNNQSKRMTIPGPILKELTLQEVPTSSAPMLDHINNHTIPSALFTTDTKATLTISKDFESLVLTDIDTFSESELHTLEHITTNITDDVKVNLRMISKTKSKLIQPKTYCKQINKRYSSIFSTACLDRDRKALNRRSLNIAQHEISRIPICAKGYKVDDEISYLNKTDTDAKVLQLRHDVGSISDNSIRDLTLNRVKSKTPSNLPVFIKRPPPKK